MINLISILALGFFLGMRHATDPDHVIAVTTIVSGQRNLTRAALTGVFWGIGHTLTILVVGTCIIYFKLVVSPRQGLAMELSVGLMLVALGVMNVVSFFRAIPKRSHDRDSHGQNHVPLAAMDRAWGKYSLYSNLRPLLVGIVHGLAGSAAVALLVLATINNARWEIAYLVVFGLGTIAGMMLITMSIASAFRYVGVRSELFGRRLGLTAGILSLGFGLFLAYQIGFVHGLFTGNPHWIPK